MENEDLKRLYRDAAEIAKVVPESMQEAAFHRALDSLTGIKPAEKEAGTRTRVQKPGGSSSQREKGNNARIDQLMQTINRTKYPLIAPANKVLFNSLWLLRAAKEECKIDGLTAAEISRVLTGKFRVSTGSSAVRMAVGGAGDKVDRVPEGQAYLYRIMQAGEEYLDKPVSMQDGGGDAGSARGARTRRHKSKKAGNQDGSSPNGNRVAATKPDSSIEPERTTASGVRPKRAVGRPGPMDAVQELIATQFFSSPRKIADIQAHLEQKRGHRYKLTDLSPTLVRLLRAGKLDRERDEAGQYEYSSK